MSRSKCDSSTYSYYFDRLNGKLYDFNDKERAVRNYIVYMLNRTQKIFEYKGLPDTIPKRMLEFLLQINGFACFAKHEGKVYAFWGGLGGEPDVYYRPTICTVSNPALMLSKTFKIDDDCVIMRNDSFLYGLIPMFRRYATAMVENDISFKLAAVNTRIEALLSAPDDATKSAAEKYLQDIEAGKLGVIASNEFLDGIKAQPVKSSLRTFTDLIEYQQYLKASWFNEIGLNANYNMKREKLSTTESQMNNDALLPLVDDMLESRREALKKINAMFDLNIEVDFASSWEKLLEEFESNQLDGGDGDGDNTPKMAGDSDIENDGDGRNFTSTGDDEENTGERGISEPAEADSEMGDSDVGDEGESEVTTEEPEVTIEVNVNVNTDENSESEVEEVEGETESDSSVSEDSDE